MLRSSVLRMICVSRLPIKPPGGGAVIHRPAKELADIVHKSNERTRLPEEIKRHHPEATDQELINEWRPGAGNLRA
jgi:hypothetical protein